MMEINLSYLNQISSQMILICVFLGGFSATLLGNFILSDKKGKVLNLLTIGTAIATVLFIIAVFGLTTIIAMTLPDNPFPIKPKDVILPRTLRTLAFLLGLISLLFVIGTSGWLKSKKMGIATTIIASLGFLLTMISVTRFG